MTTQREPDLFRLPPGQTNVPNKQTFNLEITYGASAPSAAHGKDLELSSTATGKVTVTFPRTYRKLEGFRWGWKSCAAGAVFFPVILTNNITTAGTAGSNTGGQLVIETRTEAGTATNPANGDILSLEFDVSLDSLSDGYAITVT